MKLPMRLTCGLVLALALVACGNKGDLVLPSPPEATPQEEPAPQ
jgi:predicted small lipoprotein YifL